MLEGDIRSSELRIRVAGLTFRVASSESDGPRLALPEVSRRFAASADVAADINLQARWGDLSGELSAVPVFDSGGTWTLHREDPVDVFRLWAGQWPSIPYLECRMNPDRSTGEVILHREFYEPDEPVPVFQYPLDEVLMVYVLGQGRGVELHACGVVSPDGRGFLFLGHSGDGKSTTARLWEQLPGAIVLSDDRIVVREEAGRFVMYGTPWHGEAHLAANVAAPVEAVFFLERGDENRVFSVSMSDATARLAARSFLAFYDIEALQGSLGFFGRLAGSVPCKRFAFVPDVSARDFIRAGGTLDSLYLSARSTRATAAISIAVAGGPDCASAGSASTLD